MIILRKWLCILIIGNLVLTALILLEKIHFINMLSKTLVKGILIPLFTSVFLYYIIKPLNNHFIKNGVNPGKSGALTLLICTIILSILLTYFSKYAFVQFEQITKQLLAAANDKQQIDGYINLVNNFINVNEIYALVSGVVKNYIQHIGRSFMVLTGYFMNTFSTVFLIIVILYYMLKDGSKFKDKACSLVPAKYRGVLVQIMSDSDTILSHYVTGQAKIALALAIMMFLGYMVIGIPNGLLLSVITFMLAFIPFVGFFISMIIPVVIALSMGMYVTLKLLVLFIIVQILKGRVVVPVIMAKTMRIHPLTDIFLVIGAIAMGGPFAAFVVVPVYAIIKNIILVLRKKGYF